MEFKTEVDHVSYRLCVNVNILRAIVYSNSHLVTHYIHIIF